MCKGRPALIGIDVHWGAMVLGGVYWAWVGSKRKFRILGANAQNGVNTAKFLSPAKPAKSPLGRGKTAKFSPARSARYNICTRLSTKLRGQILDDRFTLLCGRVAQQRRTPLRGLNQDRRRLHLATPARGMGVRIKALGGCGDCRRERAQRAQNCDRVWANARNFLDLGANARNPAAMANVRNLGCASPPYYPPMSQ